MPELSTNTIYTQSRRKWYNGLAGLRGVAIWMVLICHNFGFFSTKIEFFSQFGVDLFFVLSGFLITEILLNTAGKSNYFYNFYIKRAFRILPIYFLVTAIALFIARLIPEFHPNFEYYFHNVGYLFLYLQNWLFVFKPSHLEGSGIFGHYWSLGIEEQFYLIFPLIILILRKNLKLLVYLLMLFIFLLITFRFIFWVNLTNLLDMYLTPFKTRYDGIVVGAILAVYKNTTDTSLKGLIKKYFIGFFIFHFFIFLFIKVAGLKIPHMLIIGFTSISLVFALVVWHSLNRSSPIYKILNNKFLAFFAEISYGLYLIHAVVSSFLQPYFESYPIPHNLLARFIFGLIVTMISVLLSYWSFKYFESPIMKKRKKFLRPVNEL